MDAQQREKTANFINSLFEGSKKGGRILPEITPEQVNTRMAVVAAGIFIEAHKCSGTLSELFGYLETAATTAVTSFVNAPNIAKLFKIKGMSKVTMADADAAVALASLLGDNAQSKKLETNQICKLTAARVYQAEMAQAIAGF